MTGPGGSPFPSASFRSMGDAATAICMATYEPDGELFAAQVESIRAQTVTDWICMISDDGSSPEAQARIESAIDGDERFRLLSSGRRLGFYLNFERVLSQVPAGTEHVALADQDDRWSPGKLEALHTAIGPAPLAYGDARIVDREGRVLAPTFWSERRPNDGDLASLLFANSVTGAAALFRRDCSTVRFPFRASPAGPSTTTGWRWWRLPAARSHTSTSRSTTTSSTGGRCSATAASSRATRRHLGSAARSAGAAPTSTSTSASSVWRGLCRSAAARWRIGASAGRWSASWLASARRWRRPG